MGKRLRIVANIQAVIFILASLIGGISLLDKSALAALGVAILFVVPITAIVNLFFLFTIAEILECNERKEKKIDDLSSLYFKLHTP